MNPSPNTTEDWSQITKLFESTRELYELADLQFSNCSCEGAGFMSDLSVSQLILYGLQGRRVDIDLPFMLSRLLQSTLAAPWPCTCLISLKVCLDVPKPVSTWGVAKLT